MSHVPVVDPFFTLTYFDFNVLNRRKGIAFPWVFTVCKSPRRSPVIFCVGWWILGWQSRLDTLYKKKPQRSCGFKDLDMESEASLPHDLGIRQTVFKMRNMVNELRFSWPSRGILKDWALQHLSWFVLVPSTGKSWLGFVGTTTRSSNTSTKYDSLVISSCRCHWFDRRNVKTKITLIISIGLDVSICCTVDYKCCWCCCRSHRYAVIRNWLPSWVSQHSSTRSASLRKTRWVAKQAKRCQWFRLISTPFGLAEETNHWKFWGFVNLKQYVLFICTDCWSQWDFTDKSNCGVFNNHEDSSANALVLRAWGMSQTPRHTLVVLTDDHNGLLPPSDSSWFPFKHVSKTRAGWSYSYLMFDVHRAWLIYIILYYYFLFISYIIWYHIYYIYTQVYV